MLRQNRNSAAILKTSLANRQRVTSTLMDKNDMIEFCIQHTLKITDTFLKHKPIHLTTRQSPAVPYVNHIDSKTNTQEKNL